MHATVQPGGRSPKPMNSSQLKPGSDSIQTPASFPSHVKGKKRERSDQGPEPIKRERTLKTEDGDLGPVKPESNLKLEISKITGKGGLVDTEGVEKLVLLMQSDRTEKRMDLNSQSMLAAMIAATDRHDCLSQFVHLKGLSVLDEWLQDIHKGKIGDGSPKDGDKPVEEFLVVLLRALDRLPVNLQALQMCNIGKSVNHLRTNKNLEIQKKARSLVDKWKKRVEAEMIGLDAKSGSGQAVSWPSRSRLPEVSHSGNRQTRGSTEVATRSSVTLVTASKTPVKPVHSELAIKSTSSTGPTKSAMSPASGKDGQSRVAFGSTADIPSTAAREDRSSSSSQSHNNSQSCSSDHTKTLVLSGKEDARSSTAGSISMSKSTGGSSRHRRSINGFAGSGLSGGHGEIGSSRSSKLHRNPASKKDVVNVEGNSHKFIVKLPNGGRSPAQSVSGGSVDDPSIVDGRAASPLQHDHSDRNLIEKIDNNRAIASDVNAESWQSNDLKDILSASDEADGSPDAIPEEEQCRTAEDAAKLLEVSKVGSSTSGNELKAGKLHESSFNSINALIESVKYSEANVSPSDGDDAGMNLLASVATGEMLAKSDLISPNESPQRSAPLKENSSMGDEAQLKSSDENNVGKKHSQSVGDAVTDMQKQDASPDGGLCSMDGLYHPSMLVSDDLSGNGNTSFPKFEQTPRGVGNEDLRQTVEQCSGNNERSDAFMGASPTASSSVSPCQRVLNGEESQNLEEKVSAVTGSSIDGILNGKPMGRSSFLADDKVNVVSSINVENETIEGSSPNVSLENEENKSSENEGLHVGGHTEQKLAPGMIQGEHGGNNDDKLLQPSDVGKSAAEMNGGRIDETDTKGCSNQTGMLKFDQGVDTVPANGKHVLAILPPVAGELKVDNLDADDDNKENVMCHAVSEKESTAIASHETGQHVKLRVSKMTEVKADKAEDCNSTMADASLSSAKAADSEMKLKFDLNEGFVGDESKYVKPINLTAPRASVHLVNSWPFSVSPVSSGFPASITIAAAAKGPFVYPDDLMKSKGKPGWKGSAATSAFRPAEPRKVLEIPLSATAPIPDTNAGKHGRPVLDIDLNVPDEGILDDIASRNLAQGTMCSFDQTSGFDSARNNPTSSAPARSSGGLDLDLNQVDEDSEMGQSSVRCGHRMDASFLPAKPSSSGGFSNYDVRRDFDLNDGPTLDETNTEPSFPNQNGRSSMQSQPTVTGLRMNNADMGNLLSWFPPGNTYSAVSIPSILPGRMEQPFPMVATGTHPRILGPSTGGTPFTPDVYRGPVLSSSPAVPFPSTPFQYPVFPFGTSFPLPSASCSGGSATFMDSSGGRLCFPTVNAQLLGPATAVSSHYPRPYVVSVQDSSNNVAENNRKWGRQSLDLNAGPGTLDIESKDETSPLAARQLSVASSQALAEEQARMYQQVAGNVLKRKDPEGGWDNPSFRYKQASWQ